MTTERRTVVITGAARGIGKCIAQAFAAQDATLALVDLLADPLEETAAELRATGVDVLPLAADITKTAQVQAMAARLLAAYGPPDVLVNCAGTFSVIGNVWEVDPERWFRDVKVNLYGSFLVCHHLLGPMVERGSGYVVNITSTGGISDPHPQCTSYASSKTGLVRLTEGLAAETQAHGLKVFAVGPPAILSDMTRFILNDEAGKKWRPNFAKLFEEKRDYPPESVAELVLALVSGRVDRLTGRYFDVRWDLDALLAEQAEIVAQNRLTLGIRT